MYGGKTGKELTDAIRADGYDGILTKDDYGLSESVDLYKGKGGVDMASIAAPIATGLGATMLPSQKAEASEISDTPYQAQKETSPEKQAMLDKIFKNIVGAGEVGLSVGSGIASDAVAGLGGIYSGLTGGDAAATVEGLQDAAQLYTPRTEAGQAQLRGIADIIEETGQYWGPRGLDQSIENFRTSQDYLNRLGSRVDPRVGAAMATTLGILPEIL